MNRILVVHPKDRTTDFLKSVYQGRDDVTTITGWRNQSKIKDMIKAHDQVVLMGHGTPFGLLSSGWSWFNRGTSYVVDDSYGSLLAEKDNTVFIWCYASDYVNYHGLGGFTTGMFISEDIEARLMRVHASVNEIDESNNLFSRVVGKHLGESPRAIYAAVADEYGELAGVNPVAAYNMNRMAHTTPRLNREADQYWWDGELKEVNTYPQPLHETW